MSTHPIGQGKRTLGVCMPEERVNEIMMRADKVGVSTARYCRTILIDFLDSGKTVSFAETKKDVDEIKKKIKAGEKAPPRETGAAAKLYGRGGS